jgi:hypothetical protein
MDAASAPITNPKLVLSFVIAGIEFRDLLKKRDAISAEMFPAPCGRLNAESPPFLMRGRQDPKGVFLGHFCHLRRERHGNDA